MIQIAGQGHHTGLIMPCDGKHFRVITSIMFRHVGDPAMYSLSSCLISLFFMASTERTTSRQIAVATLARRNRGITGRSTMRCRITAPPSLLRSPRSRTWIRRTVGAATDRRSLRLRWNADQNAQDRCGQRRGANVYGDQKDDQPALALLKSNLERPVSYSACIVFIRSSSTATLRSIQPADFQQSPLDLL